MSTWYRSFILIVLGASMLFLLCAVAYGEEIISVSTADAISNSESVFFGRYEQDNNIDDGEEPIEWLVLDKKGDKVLLISKYVLDARMLNEYDRNSGRKTFWASSELRNWLNDSFLQRAFNTAEQNAIQYTYLDNSDASGYQALGNIYGFNSIYISTNEVNTKDRIFLLNVKELQQYFDAEGNGNLWSAKKAVTSPTLYAKANGVPIHTSSADDYSGNSDWWLRSPIACTIIYDVDLYLTRKEFMYVSYNGQFGNRTLSSDSILGVRPAMWVNSAALTNLPQSVVQIDLFAEQEINNKISSFKYNNGSLSFPYPDDEHKMFLKIGIKDNNQDDNTLIHTETFKIHLPDGLSFEEKNRLALEKNVSITFSGSTGYIEPLPVYLYSLDNPPESLIITVTGYAEGKQVFPVIAETPQIHLSDCNGVERIMIPGTTNLKGILSSDFNQYDNNLALLGAQLSGAAYSKSQIIRSMQSIGLQDVYFFDSRGDDDVACCLGNKVFTSQNNEQKTLLVLVIRGTTGEDEWAGNFTVMSSQAAKHGINAPEEYQASFYAAAENVRTKLRNYCEILKIDPSTARAFICGHSRGAAVADVLSDSLNNKYWRTYFSNFATYTIAAPNSTKNPVSYDNVHNILFAQDIVPVVPQSYYKFGKNYVVGPLDASEAPYNVRQLWSKYTDTAYVMPNNQMMLSILCRTDFLNRVSGWLNSWIGGKLANAESNGDCSHDVINYISWIEAGTVTSGNYISYGEANAHFENIVTDALANTANLASGISDLFGRSDIAKASCVVSHMLSIMGQWNGNRRLYRIGCPVSWTIQDHSGDILVSFDNHEIVYQNADKVFAFVENGEDYVLISEDYEISLYITGTGEGTMTFVEVEISSEDELLHSVLQEDITVKTGQLFTMIDNSDSTGHILINLDDEGNKIFMLPIVSSTIGEEAFCGIAAETIYIPASVKHIRSKAFANCPNLKKIVFANGNLDVAGDFVSGCPHDLVIEAPEGSIVTNNLALYFRYICPPPEDPERPGDDDFPEGIDPGHWPVIVEEEIPNGAGNG